MFAWERRALGFVQRHIYWFAAGLVLLISLYIRYSFWPLVSNDIIAMKRWLRAAQSGGMTEMLKDIDYSAFYCYLFYILSKLRLPVTSYTLIKIPFVVFEYLCIGACTLLAYRFSDRHKQRNAFTVFTLLCLSPVMVLNAAGWGQCDTMYTLFIVLCLLALHEKKPVWAMIWYGIALSLKLQAVLVFPALLLMWFVRRERSFLWFLLLPLIVWVSGLPLAAFGGGLFYNLREYLFHGTSQQYWATKNYPGFYALFGSLLDPYQQKDYAHIYMFMKLGFGLAIGVIALMYVNLIRRNIRLEKENLVLLFAWTALTAVFFMPHMHERYGMIGEVLLLCYAALRNKTVYYGAWLLSAIVTVFAYKVFLYDATVAPQQIGAYVNLGILVLLSRELLTARIPSGESALAAG